MSKFAALALEVEKPARMTIVHPVTREPLKDGEGNEAYIDLHSGDSAVARRQQQSIQRRRLASRGRKVTLEEIESDALDFLAALAASWRLVGLDGSAIDVPFSTTNARELFGESSMAWLREQVDEFSADRANFSKASSTT